MIASSRTSMLPAMTALGPRLRRACRRARLERACDRQQNAERADLDRVPAESAGGVDAAEATAIPGRRCRSYWRAGTRHRPWSSANSASVSASPQALAQRFAPCRLAWIIRRQQEHRPQHEDDEPDAGQRTRDAIALWVTGVEPEQRRKPNSVRPLSDWRRENRAPG